MRPYWTAGSIFTRRNPLVSELRFFVARRGLRIWTVFLNKRCCLFAPHFPNPIRPCFVGTSCARSDFYFIKIGHPLHGSSLAQKVTQRLRCPLVNARAALRLATNFLRETGSIHHKKWQALFCGTRIRRKGAAPAPVFIWFQISAQNF